jgi:hypothetical protein
MPTINQIKVSRLNCSLIKNQHTSVNKNPMIVKMVPPLVLALPVGMDSILEPLAGALGAFRQ